MEFLKTRKAGVLVLVLSVLFGTLYGSHRSLMFISGRITAQNEMVMKGLETRVGVGENLYTVAGRYLPQDQLTDLRDSLNFLTDNCEDMVGGYTYLTAAIRGVLFQMEKVDGVTEQDAKYLTGFSAQLESGVSTIARDPYTIQAEEFNTEILGRFPANILHTLTGVKKLPVYQ